MGKVPVTNLALIDSEIGERMAAPRSVNEQWTTLLESTRCQVGNQKVGKANICHKNEIHLEEVLEQGRLDKILGDGNGPTARMGDTVEGNRRSPRRGSKASE